MRWLLAVQNVLKMTKLRLLAQKIAYFAHLLLAMSSACSVLRAMPKMVPVGAAWTVQHLELLIVAAAHSLIHMHRSLDSFPFAVHVIVAMLQQAVSNVCL
jgi:hypothetical protein